MGRQFAQLDHVVIDDGWKNAIKDWEVDRNIKFDSDHFVTRTDIVVKPSARGDEKSTRPKNS